MAVPKTYAGWFRFIAFAEACSWAGLLISMAFKYGLDLPQGVTVFGWVHGLVFTAYVVASLVVCGPLRWSFPVLLLALIASVPPLVTLLFEWWARARGDLMPGDPAEPTLWQRIAATARQLN